MIDHKHQTTSSDFFQEYEHHLPPVKPKKKLRISLYAQIAFLAILGVLIGFYRQSEAFGTLSIIFVSIFLEALPFILIGSLIGGFIEMFVSKDMITRCLPKTTWLSIFIAAGVGLIFPVCECAIIPVVRRLFKKGLPLGAGIAFLLGGPIVNPLVALSTGVAYGYDWSIVINRMVFGYLIAVIIGLFIEMVFEKRAVLTDDALENNVQCSCGHDHHCDHDHGETGTAKKITRAIQHAANDFFDIGRFLVVGAFIAAFLQAMVAREDMALIAGSQVFSIIGMMFLAIILNLCSEADAFVAASLRTTLPLAAQLAFMILGPMLDIKLILMYFRIFRNRLILTLSFMTFAIVFLSMLIKSWGYAS